MKAAGLENNELKIWHAYNEMKVAVIYGDEDMYLYNGSVAQLNKATRIFNDFIQYRNNRFIPARPAAETYALFDSIASAIAAAHKKIAAIGKTVENVQYDTGGLKQRLDALAARLREQKDFFTLYTESSEGGRGKLFFNKPYIYRA